MLERTMTCDEGHQGATPSDPAPRNHIPRVTHVITGLSSGGAEMALFRAISATRDQAIHSVVSLTDEGVFGAQLAALGVPVSCLDMRPGVPDPVAVVRLARLLRQERPDLVHGWMYHANLIAGVAAMAAGGIPVVWGIRHSELRAGAAKWTTRWTNVLCAWLSGWLPARIVCCADSALRWHAAMGYRADRMTVIPNGFDSEAFAPDQAARLRSRSGLAIPATAPIVGLVSRFHADKDPDCFLRAARLVSQERRDAVFLLVGSGLTPSQAALAARIEALGIRDHVRLLGARSDVPALLAAMDVFALCSRTEAFPNALAEAMLCGVPCVATDCGDARVIVGPSGRIVPPGDSDTLGRSILDLLALGDRERANLGGAARERVRTRYDIRVVARRYLELYAEVAGARRHGPGAHRGRRPQGVIGGGPRCG